MYWDTVKLFEISMKIGSGATPRGGKESYKTNGITLVRSLNIYDFYFEEEGLAFIDKEQARLLDNVAIRLKDILLNITGASVARCWTIPKHLLPARVNQHVAIIRINENLANPRYVLYCINSPQYKERLLALAQGGATREALTKNIISNFQVASPPLPIQHKIAAILSAYDELIENNTRRIKLLEEMAHILYREWFVHFRFPGHEKVKFVESELGRIPEGWGVVKLKNIATEVRRNINPSKVRPETPYIGLEHIPQKTIAISNWGEARQVKSTKLSFKQNEILFGKIRPYLHKVVVSPFDGICSSDTIVISPIEDLFFAVTLAVVSSSDLVAYASTTSQGTHMPRANWKVLSEYHIVFSREILLIFNQLVENIVRKIYNLITQNTNLRQTRDLLLPKLISGEIDVSDLDIKGTEPFTETSDNAFSTP